LYKKCNDDNKFTTCDLLEFVDMFSAMILTFDI